VIPYVIASVKTAEGKTVYRRAEGGLGRVVDPAIAGAMNSMMRETLLTGTARRADLPGWEAAGKTGTSQEFRDAWFVGYTGALVAGVWLGNDDGEPTKRVSGSNLPVEIWSRFMKAALAGERPVALPGTTRAPAVAAAPSRQRSAEAAAPAGDGAWIPPDPAERGLLERLFGIR
jgi:penicillin-binding protein 1A